MFSTVFAKIRGLLPWGVAPLLAVACHKQPPPPPPKPAPVAPVSAIRQAALEDTARLSDTQVAFLNALRPAVAREDAQIATDRRHLKVVAAEYLAEGYIEEKDFNWLKQLADQYRLRPKSRSDHHFFNELLERVDEVPEPVVLAHVAADAGWLRPYRSVDAVTMRQRICYQQFCVNRDKLTPAPPALPPVETRKALRAYLHLVNTDGAYHDFRVARAGQRQHGKALDSVQLADALPHPGADLPPDIISRVITSNSLQDKGANRP